MRLSGWGRHPVVECPVEPVREWRDVPRLVDQDGTLIARGNGRAYGDAALNRNRTLSMLGMDRVLGFDHVTGLLTCESGVLLKTILESFLPRRWMPVVVPGTAWVTVGGMIAADVHGKNHHRDGSFGAHVESFSVLTGDGETVRCSRSENADLFHATVGGMGLTGVIGTASFRMRRIETGYVGVETFSAGDLEATMGLFEASRHSEFSVAWIDCMARGTSLGRSLHFRGTLLGQEALPHEVAGDRYRLERRSLAVPFDAPAALLNGRSVSVFNALYYHVDRLRGSRLRPKSIGSYFFPLDRIADWNRLYGRRGFAQYQCVLPKGESQAGILALLERVTQSRSGSFLAVLKLLGGQGAGVMSFPLEGFTLALDVPIRPGTAELLEALDDITHRHGGRVYLAKDAFCRPERLRQGYPHLDAFQVVRGATGAAGKFTSVLSDRLGL